MSKIDTNVFGDRRMMLERSSALIAAAVVGNFSWGRAALAFAAPQGDKGNKDGIRRIVTGHNSQGKSYVVSDTRIGAGGHLPNVFETTLQNPLGPGGPNDSSALLPSTMPQIEPPTGSCGCTYVVLPPDKPESKPFWHRTMTIDYNFLIHGEVVLILEDGSETLINGPGDVVVQRNTNHAWRNNSKTDPCIWVAVLVSVSAPHSL